MIVYAMECSILTSFRNAALNISNFHVLTSSLIKIIIEDTNVTKNGLQKGPRIKGTKLKLDTSLEIQGNMDIK